MFSVVLTTTGKFFLSLVAVTSHEDAPSTLQIFELFKAQGVVPKKVVGDAASATINATKQFKDTVHREFILGSVDYLWVVTSFSEKTYRPLKDKCISIDEFVKMRTSSNIIFFWDCWEGMRVNSASIHLP